jgi:hypothetical protein
MNFENANKNNNEENLFTSLEDSPVFRSVSVLPSVQFDQPNESTIDNTFQSFSSFGLEKPSMKSISVMSQPSMMNETKKMDDEFDFWSLPAQDDDDNDDTFKAYELTTKFSFSASDKTQLKQTNTITTTTTSSIVLNKVPLWIERYYSFFSMKTPDVVLSSLKIVLDLSNIQYNDNNGVLNGFTGDNSCDFIITMYQWSNDNAQHFNITKPSSNDKNTILIEVSRRSGCSITFSSFYRNLLASLGDNIVHRRFVDNNINQDNTTSFKPPCTENFSFKINNECTEALLAMVNSEFIDVKQEGFAALVTQTRCCDNAKRVMEYVKSNSCQLLKEQGKCPIKSAICDGLLSSEPEVRRVACQLYKNLVNEIDDSSNIKHTLDSIKEKLSQDDLRDINTLKTINAF